ncbi:hypothetical protein [Microbacterium rhizomatis]|nr:hypothetical protein [Microbacterium rhizomatis]
MNAPTPRRRRVNPTSRGYGLLTFAILLEYAALLFTFANLSGGGA